MSKYIIDIVFAVVAVVFIIFSAKKGFIKGVAGAFSLVISFVVSSFLYKYVTDYFKIYEKIYILLVFCAMFIVFLLMMKLIFGKVNKEVDDTRVAGALNRVGGALLGVIKAAVIIVLASLILHYFFAKYAADSYVVQFIVNTLKLS